VVLYTNTKTPSVTVGGDRKNRNENDPTFSQFVVGNRGRIPLSVNDIKGSNFNEYFGYSVSSGKYLSRDKVLYAAGAPRAQYRGEVVIFDYPPVLTNDTYKRQVRPILEIKAPENSFGSYFGAVVYSVDFDGDGLDELIVGAPFYTFESRSTTTALNDKDKAVDGPNKENSVLLSDDYGDHGCVFVYHFNKNKVHDNMILLAHAFKIPYSRFNNFSHCRAK